MQKSPIQIAFEQTQELINHFEAGIEHYLSPSYQEAEVRKEYIDKFYTFLGWDVNHDFQKNPFEQEVKIEKAQRQQGALGQKRADYAFFLAPNYKQEQFFVEAKKPSRTLRQNKDDYFQTAKYGWNAGTGVSILTDFEEIVIIDCRFRPDFETILQNQIKYYNYKDFRDFDTFEEFYWIFSREALVAGSLTKYIEQLKKPKGTATQLKLFGGKYQSIDESFLNYIDAKRYELATAFYQNNTSLDAYSLTEATQRTIDRIVFIRFLEDKLIETENIIHNIATANYPWAKFVEECKRLEAKYNGIVFKPLFIDDKKFAGADNDLFRALCSDLDHTNTPYDFNYIPIHILGSIYERFLGKVVVIENGIAKIELKPEVRKAGGVFYTPKYIVDYIVKNTVGKLIENKTPKQIAELTFADIACGSGSFLIGVFEYLLDYHNQWYNQNPTVAKKDGCKFNEDFGVYVLSIQQKQNILLNNIYGVDIDLQATEVTQLSLFLKMLEDETTSTANDMMVLFHEKILPNLSNNIKCGNSLIGTDILTNKLDLDLDQERKLNPFDFKMAFPKVFGNSNLVKVLNLDKVEKEKGFDAIVGNPPYLKLTTNNQEKIILDYYNLNYKSLNGGSSKNLFQLFIEKVIELEPKYFSYIIPEAILTSSSNKIVRNLILKNNFVEDVLIFDHFVFQDATIGTTVLTVSDKKTAKSITEVLKCNKSQEIKSIKQISLTEKDEIWNTFENNSFLALIKKIDKSTNKVGGFVEMSKGMVVKNRKDVLEDNSTSTNLPFLLGNCLKRYNLTYDKYANYSNLEIIGGTRDYKKQTTTPRLLIRRTGNFLCVTFSEKVELVESTIYILRSSKINLKYLLGLFNSKLLTFYLQQGLLTNTQGFPQVLMGQLEQLPIPILTASNQETHDQIVNLVEQMLAAKKQQQTVVTERDKSYLDDKCKNIDHQINELVYQLYGLNEEEISIIEKA